jgi:DNA-binding MarR family transcriptional regulator
MTEHLAENPYYQLWVLLHQTRDALHKVREKEVARYNITATQSAVLFIIDALGEKATPRLISSWFLREPHSISSILTRMEKQGLITKQRNPDNLGELKISLTEKGRQTYDKSCNIDLIKEILGSLSGEERKLLAAFLVTLRDQALQHLIELPYVPFP